MTSILDYIQWQAETNGNKIFVTQGTTKYSYLDIFNHTKKLAYKLKQKVAYGDRVILSIHQHTDYLLAYFACLSIGAIPVNIYNQPTEFVKFVIDYTQAKLMIANQFADITDFDIEVIDFPDFLEAENELWLNERHEIAAILFTSGTTGKPKGVMLSHENLLTIGKRNIQFSDLQANDRELVAFPLSVTSGLGPIHGHLIAGGEVFWVEKITSPEELLAVFDTERITGFFTFPGMLKKLVENYQDLFHQKAKHLKYILVNSTPMAAEIVQKVLDTLPNTHFCMYYGMTEASRSLYNFYRQNPTKLNSAGKTVEDGEVKIFEPNENGIGEICLRGTNTFLAYWQDDYASKLCKDTENWVHSGDLGTIDCEGFVTVIGRLKEQINVGGWKCQPNEIEGVLNKHPKVINSAVVALPDADLYEIVGAMVVTNEAITVEELQNHCLKHLKLAFKVPKYILFAAQIPINHLGKTQKKEVEIVLKNAFCITI